MAVLLTSAALIGCSEKQAVRKDDTQPSVQNKVDDGKEYQGPFGLAEGIPVDELISKFGFSVTKEDPDVYSGLPPKPNEKFSDYTYIATKKHGLCKIVAFTKTIETNSFSEQAVDLYKEISGNLESKYGKPSFDFNYIEKGSVWDQPEDLSTALSKNEAKIEKSWFDKEKGVTLPNKLSAISIKIIGTEKDEAFVTLAYTFNVNEKCVEHFKEEQKSSL